MARRVITYTVTSPSKPLVTSETARMFNLLYCGNPNDNINIKIRAYTDFSLDNALNFLKFLYIKQILLCIKYVY